ncbi:MAG: redoxin domain-containing protein [bacterium]
MLKIGDPIPELSFEAYQAEKINNVKLSDYKGKWLVLLFYPADFTFVCPTELKDAANFYSDFQKIGAEIASVSTDTVFAHKAWHDSSPAVKQITYPMIADPSGKICKAFGTYIEEEGLSLRATFIVNPEGILVAYEMHNNNIGRNTAEILRKLEAAIYVQDHNGEVCPANWKPGDKTLKPGLDIVGKI